jgi:hypothetical protein
MNRAAKVRTGFHPFSRPNTERRDGFRVSLFPGAYHAGRAQGGKCARNKSNTATPGGEAPFGPANPMLRRVFSIAP